MGPETVTFQFIAQVGVLIMALWGFYKVVSEIVKTINARHDKEQKWDEMEEKLTKNIQAERDKIYDRYDSKLEEIEEKIEENNTNSEAKIQQIKAELELQTECLQAILAGLHELKCNGPVTVAKEKLDDFITHQAHR